MSNKPTLTETINDLMAKTVDAYSRPRYGEEAWRWSIVLLLSLRYTPSQAYQILMSKYMRWAADAHGVVTMDVERLNGYEIAMYHKKQKIDIKSLMAEVTK